MLIFTSKLWYWTNTSHCHSLSTSWWKLRVCWWFSVRFEFIRSTAVNLHWLSREEEPYISMEVDLSRFRTLEPKQRKEKSHVGIKVIQNVKAVRIDILVNTNIYLNSLLLANHSMPFHAYHVWNAPSSESRFQIKTSFSSMSTYTFHHLRFYQLITLCLGSAAPGQINWPILHNLASYYLV